MGLRDDINKAYAQDRAEHEKTIAVENKHREAAEKEVGKTATKELASIGVRDAKLLTYTLYDALARRRTYQVVFEHRELPGIRLHVYVHATRKYDTGKYAVSADATYVARKTNDTKEWIEMYDPLRNVRDLRDYI